MSEAEETNTHVDDLGKLIEGWKRVCPEFSEGEAELAAAVSTLQLILADAFVTLYEAKPDAVFWGRDAAFALGMTTIETDENNVVTMADLLAQAMRVEDKGAAQHFADGVLTLTMMKLTGEA